MKRFQIVILFAFVFLSAINAQDAKVTSFPTKDFNNEVNPIASEDAEVGGRIVIFGHQYPKSFNYYTDQNSFSAALFGKLFESLLSTHPITLETIPGIVNKWTVSEDKTTYTLNIDPKAKWSDGKAITSEDVVFTYDIVMKSMTGPWKSDFSKISRPEIINEKTFKIIAQEVHWKTEGIISNIIVLPKHNMEGKELEKLNFEFPVVSGPYKLKEVKEDNFAELERRSDWWARDYKCNQGIYNFQFVKYRFFSEESNGFASFQKGEIDLYAVYMAKRWIEMATGEKYDKNLICKQKIYNFEPLSWQGFAMNMRRPLFQDKRVRQALAHLLNRDRFNDELMFKQYEMTNSYFTDLYSKERPMKNRIVDFNIEKAKKLLDEAGWKPNKNGILEKDGLVFEFSFLTNDGTSNKFLDIYGDDLKNVGIKLKIVQKDRASWTRDMDNFSYDMTWAAWGSALFKDPESQWHSKEAINVSGFNYPGFKSEVVDQLIEKQKTEFNVEKRNDILREIDAILTEEQPYILLWHNNYTRLLYWNKFGTPDTVLSKFGDERDAVNLWWYDKDANKALEDASKSEKNLPKKDASVIFEEKFKGK